MVRNGQTDNALHVDVGQNVSVTVTATNDAGSASATSQTVGPVTSASGGGSPTTGCAPVAGQTMSNTVSHVCGFADTTNTGVPAGTRLYRVPQDVTGPLPDGSTGSGWSWSSGSGITLNSGAVLKSVVYTGGLAVRTSNVTVRTPITTSGENSWAISLWHASSPTIRNTIFMVRVRCLERL